MSTTLVAGQEIRLQRKNIIGGWSSIQEKCDNLWRFSANGKYIGHCDEMVEGGKWRLIGKDGIQIKYYEDILKETFPQKPNVSTITVTGFERDGNRTLMHVKYLNGRSDKWIKLR